MGWRFLLWTGGAFVLVALSIVLGTRDDPKPKRPYVLKEVIDVEGTCFEDHVGRRDTYAGNIVRWQNVKTGEIDTYGSVTNTGDMVQRIMDNVQHPTVYQTPFIVEFWPIDTDTDRPRWTLHGISNRGDEHSEHYDATCDLEVVKRGTELPGIEAGSEYKAGVRKDR